MCTPIELCKEDGQAVSFNLEDIDALELLSGDPHIVFSFWVGMKLATQENILKLAAECRSVRAVAVFRDAKWTSSSDVLDALSDASCSVSLCPTASPSAHLALRCLCCGCSPQASGSSRRRSKCPCTCRASGIRRGRSEDTAVCASQTSSSSSTDLGCASQMHGKLISRCCAGTPRGTSRPPIQLPLWRSCSIADHSSEQRRRRLRDCRAAADQRRRRRGARSSSPVRTQACDEEWADSGAHNWRR